MGSALTFGAYLIVPAIFVGSFTLNLLVLAYRSSSLPSVRRTFDRLQQRFSGEPDWKWLRLWHIMVPLVALTALNVAWNVSTIACSNDALAIFASGRAALHGHDPFAVTFCSGSSPDHIPYGLAEVSLNALGALAGSVLGVWLVWQGLALAVVPLVWGIGGDERRYLSVLAATSLLFLPNILTNIGVENAVIAVSVLLMVYAVEAARRGSTGFKALAAFLSTARFPAVFGLLGSSSRAGRGRWLEWLLVLGIFGGSAALAYGLWGPDAIRIVYFSQFTRTGSESGNLFALLTHEGWVEPSLTVALVQGVGLVALVLFVNWRGYTTRAACAIPLVGVMLFSQYLTYHFVIWLVPVVLVGAMANWWLLAYGVAVALNENVLYWYFALERGVWWPYELNGVLITAILICLLIVIVRDEERRLRSESAHEPRPEAPRQPAAPAAPSGAKG
jgi:hypothetical protein